MASANFMLYILSQTLCLYIYFQRMEGKAFCLILKVGTSRRVTVATTVCTRNKED
jgi:hypothetical protein